MNKLDKENNMFHKEISDKIVVKENDCKEDEIYHKHMIKNMINSIEQQKESIKYENVNLIYIEDSSMGKIALIVPKSYWDKHHNLQYDFWFNPSSELGIKLKMVGINNVELQETIYKVINQDLTIDEIEKNIKAEDIFEINEEFSKWCENRRNSDNMDNTSDTTNNEIEEISKENVIDTITTNLGDKTDIIDMSPEELAEMEKEVSNRMVVNGRKVNAKIDLNGKKLRAVKYEELKDLIKNQIQNNFTLYYWDKDEENEGQKLDVEIIQGKRLMSTNLDDDEIMIWLDTKTDLPFSIDFSKNSKGDIISLEDDGEIFTLMMEDNSILIHVEEQMTESMDLRNDEEFQKFLKKVKIYDQDRFKINVLSKEYSEKDLNYFLERMSEVGYIYSKSRFQDTGKDNDDYFFTTTNRFLRTIKFGFLDEVVKMNID